MLQPLEYIEYIVGADIRALCLRRDGFPELDPWPAAARARPAQSARVLAG